MFFLEFNTPLASLEDETMQAYIRRFFFDNLLFIKIVFNYKEISIN